MQKQSGQRLIRRPRHEHIQRSTEDKNHSNRTSHNKRKKSFK